MISEKALTRNKRSDVRSPQVDTGDGNIAKGGHGLAVDWRLDGTVDTNQVHDESHANRCPQKTLTATQGIGNKGQETGGRDHLDDAVDTGGEETRVGAG